MGFGKDADLTHEEVRSSDPDYVRWASGKRSEVKRKDGTTWSDEMQAFVEYCADPKRQKPESETTKATSEQLIDEYFEDRYGEYAAADGRSTTSTKT